MVTLNIKKYTDPLKIRDVKGHTTVTLVKERESTYVNFRQSRLKNKENYQNLLSVKRVLHKDKLVSSLRRHNNTLNVCI